MFGGTSFSGATDDHLQCMVPHYVFLTCVMTYISISVFLKLAAGIKIILMLVMGVGIIVLMEVTHAPMFSDYDALYKYVNLIT